MLTKKGESSSSITSSGKKSRKPLASKEISLCAFNLTKERPSKSPPKI